MKVKFIKSGEDKTPFAKALESQNVESTKEAEASGAHGIIPSPYPIKELQNIVEISTILQQCIDAYKRNIVGFGASPTYIDDEVAGNETPEMETEWETLQEFTRYFNDDKSFEDVLSETVEDREQTGNGYLEIIRDGQGLPAEGVRLDPAYMHITKLTDFTEVESDVAGRKLKKKKRFRKYVQDIGTKKVYYKAFGDPRTMDARTGEFVEPGSIEEMHEANEILHFKIGSKTYGIPRWIGQLIHMYGARKAEELNFNYFTQGRHTPMALMLHNAELSPESEQALTDYANSVQGTDNAHKFLVIEAEGLTEGMLDDERKNAKVELQSLAEMLQQDALFLEYDESSREKVQSAFRLPDIYVGRSKDFNRATADTARYITEEQVFEPERNSLEWVLNNKLLRPYELQHVRLNFNKPEISNSEEVVSVLKVANDIGAIAPNDVRDIIGKFLGKDLENFEGEQFDLPKGAMQAEAQLEGTRLQNEQIGQSQQSQLEKAYGDDITSVLKDVRDIMEEQYDRES